MISVAYLSKVSAVVPLRPLRPKPMMFIVEFQNESRVICRVVRPHQEVIRNLTEGEYSEGVQMPINQFPSGLITLHVGFKKSGLFL